MRWYVWWSVVVFALLVCVLLCFWSVIADVVCCLCFIWSSKALCNCVLKGAIQIKFIIIWCYSSWCHINVSKLELLSWTLCVLVYVSWTGLLHFTGSPVRSDPGDPAAWFWSGLVGPGGGWSHLYPRLRRLCRSSERKHLSAQVCTLKIPVKVYKSKKSVCQSLYIQNFCFMNGSLCVLVSFLA